MATENIERNTEAQGAGDTAPYVLRPIKAPDVFQFVRILDKIGLSNLSASLNTELFEALDFKPPTMMEGKKEIPLPENMWTAAARRARDKAEAAKRQLSIQILELLVRNLPNCENELYTLLANSIGKPVEFVLDMDATTFLHLIDDYISRDGFTDFFMQAVELLSNSRQKLGLQT